MFQPAFPVVLNAIFLNTHAHGTYEGPVTSWTQFLLYWDWVVSFTKTGGFWEPVRGITNGGSWVVIHMMEHPPVYWVVNVAQYVLRKWSFTGKISRVLSLFQLLLVQFWLVISKNYCIASPQILRSFKGTVTGPVTRQRTPTSKATFSWRPCLFEDEVKAVLHKQSSMSSPPHAVLHKQSSTRSPPWAVLHEQSSMSSSPRGSRPRGALH